MLENYSLKTRSLKDLNPVLKDSSASAEVPVYLMARGNPNITILLPGTNNGEYYKTFGHYHKDNREETYKILYGSGCFILQRVNKDDWGCIRDIRVVRVNQGDIVEVPEGFGHALVNTGDVPLITKDNAPANAETDINDYSEIEKRKGFAVYIVEKNGNIGIEKNTNYDLSFVGTQDFAFLQVK